MRRYIIAFTILEKSLPRFHDFQGSAPTRAVAESWDHGVALNVHQGGPTIWPMEGSSQGLQRTLRRVPAFQKNELYAWYLVYEYPGTAVYVFCISRHHLFCGQLLVLRATPGLMGRAQGRSPPPHSFSEDCSNVRREVFDVRSPTTPSSPQELAQKNTYYVPGT